MNPPQETGTEHDGLDPEAERMVMALESLMEGEGVVTALIAMGRRAVPPLRRFLLQGRISTVYQPRQWSVRALGGLDAREVLMDYLTSEPPSDPQLRFAEEAVRNTAVLEFLRWPDEITKGFLLSLSERSMLAGLAECFGHLHVTEAIPFLDRALEDDVCRPRAEVALAEIGEPARPALVFSAVTRLPLGGAETPSSLIRRRAALRVLLEIGIQADDWPFLEPLLQDEDPEVLVRACCLSVKAGIQGAQRAGIPALIAVSAASPWFLNEDLVACLIAWKEEALPVVAAEAQRRLKAPILEQVQDQTLRLLLRVARLSGLDLQAQGQLRQ